MFRICFASFHITRSFVYPLLGESLLFLFPFVALLFSYSVAYSSSAFCYTVMQEIYDYNVLVLISGISPLERAVFQVFHQHWAQAPINPQSICILILLHGY